MRKVILIPVLAVLPLNAGGIQKDKQLHFFAGAAIAGMNDTEAEFHAAETAREALNPR